MTTVELLANLQRAEIHLWVEDGNLRVRGPRAKLTSELREELARRKDEILSLLADRQSPRTTAPLERRAPRRGEQPLSFIQERLWFLYQLQPDNIAYNIVAALRFRVPLDTAAIDRTMTEIVRRHDVLRTTVVSREGLPFAMVAPPSPIQVRVVDLRFLPSEEQRREAERMKDGEARQPFDLTAGPLLRLSILQYGEQDWELLTAQHHIVSDRWSIGVLMNEVQALYRDFAAGKPSSLAELPVQYADFAIWQRERMEDDLARSQLAYWLKQLGGDLPVLDLPTDRPRPSIQTTNGTWESRALSAPVAAQIRLACRRLQVTPFMLFIAAFSALLQRWTGQDDILIGSPIAGRSNPKLEGLIGCFVNSLVLRTDVSGDPGFGELLARVRRTALDAYSNPDVPFERLVADLQPRRDLSRSVLYQVSLAFQSAPKSVVVGDTVTTTTSAGALFDLTLFVVEAGDSFLVTAEYNVDLFDRSTIARLLDSFERLIEGATADAERPLSTIPIVSPTDRERLVREWNDTALARPDLCLNQLVEAQAARTPDSLAVKSGDSELSYRDLNAKANQLARFLRGRGVGPDVLVGIAMERSLETVVAILAVLKAGGAYVPIDPEYPQERLAFMFSDSKVELLLTQSAFVSTLDSPDMPVFCIGPDSSLCDDLPADNLPQVASPDNLAYVIYTSGSTGRPKGAMNAHRGIVNRIMWKQDTYRLTTADRMLQKAPYGFDVSVWEMFWPLMVGAAVVVAPPGAHKNTEELIDLIEAYGVTTVHFVPSMLQLFLESSNVERCRSLVRVFCGGEPLPVALHNEFAARLSAVLYNQYGPTETAADVTWWRCSGQAVRSIPIGRPSANVQLYILDRHLQPVPIGVPGELCVGGMQVARGYLHRPALTAERFVPDPFGEPGGRLYKTGDLVRYRAGGEIEYLERLDGQVKIRGVRIELGELEAALVAHDTVKDALAMVYEAEPGDKRLVAYFACEEHASLTATELRRFLRQRLPEYMLPSFFVKLPQIPLMPNGKVDRSALPRPFETAVRPEQEYVAPRTATEQRVADIWRGVLSVDTIGVHDNFFDIGGHSLLSLRVIAQIDKIWGVRLHPNLMFLENLEQIATRCERLLSGDSATETGLPAAARPAAVS